MTALALDVGDKRIGVAVSDPTELLARPLAVVNRKSNLWATEEIGRFARETDARVVVVGLPLRADGEPGEQAQKTRAFVRFLRRHLPIEVVTWNEGFSTQDAQAEMIAQGVRRDRRRAMLDAAAAAIILDDWLTAHRGETGGSSEEAHGPFGGRLS